MWVFFVGSTKCTYKITLYPLTLYQATKFWRDQTESIYRRQNTCSSIDEFSL